MKRREEGNFLIFSFDLREIIIFFLLIKVNYPNEPKMN